LRIAGVDAAGFFAIGLRNAMMNSPFSIRLGLAQMHTVRHDPLFQNLDFVRMRPC
jgi:hypothetical protein